MGLDFSPGVCWRFWRDVLCWEVFPFPDALKDFASCMKEGRTEDKENIRKLVEEVFTFLWWCGPGVLSISRLRGCLSYVVLFLVEF